MSSSNASASASAASAASSASFSSSSTTSLFPFKLKLPSFIFPGSASASSASTDQDGDKKKRRNSLCADADVSPFPPPTPNTSAAETPNLVSPTTCRGNHPSESNPEAKKTPKKSGLFRWDPRRHSHAGIQRRQRQDAAPNTSPGIDYFEDEADLFEDRKPKPQGSTGPESNGTSLSDEDGGVFVASSTTSLSPTPSSERSVTHPRQSLQTRSSVDNTSTPDVLQRPASCTFGNLNGAASAFVRANYLQPNSKSTTAPSVTSEMSNFQYRSSYSTLLDPETLCPICQMCYDNSSRRKLVDSNCGHARCFQCMFKTNHCSLCGSVSNSNSSRRSSGGTVTNGENGQVHLGYTPSKKTQSLSGRQACNDEFGYRSSTFLPGSLRSRESGFQSFASSMTSVCSKVQHLSLQDQGTWPQDSDLEDENDDCISMISAFDRKSVASNSSFISLMSGQSSFRYPAADNGLSRNDNKRHSLMSFRRLKSEDGGNSLGGRNSALRRSAIITRSSRMSSIEENKRNSTIEPVSTANLSQLLRPIFFEVPNSPIALPKCFVGRKWLFREILEHFSSDLPTSRGMVIHGSSTTGKTSIILQLVQNSYFGIRASSMSSTMDILARQVIGYHFCSLDNEATCSIPEFVHSIAAQIIQCPTMAHFHNLVATSPHLQKLLSFQSCLSDPSKALVQGILEPLKLLRSQGKFPNQRSLILVDGLCEAEYHRTDNGDTIANFLKLHIHLFPNWLRMICTVRSNMLDIVKPFTFHRLSLDNGDNIDERLYKDMQDFIFQRIRESQFIKRNITPMNGKADENHQSNLAHYLTISSGGCFLYTDMILNLFHEGKLILKSTSMSMIPLSLSEIYLLEFNLRFPTSESFARVKEILAVCIASLRPMTLEDIWNCINALTKSNEMSGLSWEEFLARYQLISWILPKRADSTVMLFHATARDWLIGRRSIDSNKFICDPRDGHAAIALFLSRKLAPLDPDQTLELGHHLLKANIFRQAHSLEGLSVRHLQAVWMAMTSADLSLALASPKNITYPNLKVSRLLLLAGASPDSVLDPESQESLVIWYASQQNLDMIQLLGQFGADLNGTNSAGITALMVASARGSVPIIQYLVENGASLNATDSKGSTALVFAAKMGHLSVVSLLINCSWPATGCQLETTAQEAMIIAAKEGHVDILDCLLNNEHVKINNKCPLSGETALCAAASSGNRDSCKVLLKRGADSSMRNRNGDLPLHLATTDGHYEIVDLLMNSGVPVDQIDKQGRTPLLVAANVGQVGVIELLLTRGADKNFKDSKGLNALSWAVLGNKHKAVDLLIKQGLDIESTDLQLRTPLHHASSSSDSRIVAMLLSNNANVEANDKDGLRPIDLAISYSNETVVLQMLKKGAKLGPTTWASAKGKPRIALILLNKLLEDGNTLFRHGRLKEAAYRYEYALKRLPRLKDTCNTASSSKTTEVAMPQQQSVGEDVFLVLKSHLLLNLSRMRRKEGNFVEAIHCASEVLAFRSNCFEAYWARAKARKELKQLEDALADLREAIKLSPQNMKLHQFTMQVKAEIENAQQKMASHSDQSVKNHPLIPEIVIDSSLKKELESEV